MKLFKKIIGCAAAFAVAATVGFSAAGCKKNEGNYDFTIWCYQTDSSIRNYGETSYAFKELEKRTGKKVKFVLGDDYTTMLSTKSYPEVVLMLGYPNGYAAGINNGHVYDITDLVKNYAPNYKKLITSDEDIWKGTTIDGDRIGGFYVVNDPIEKPWRGLVMRKDVIEKYKNSFTTYSDWEDLGEKDSKGQTLLTPTLYSHWTDIFTVVKKAYNDGDKDTAVKYPLCFPATGRDSLDTLNAGFGFALGDTAYYDYVDESGNRSLKIGYVEEGLKDYLEQMNAWYKAGFIDPNFAQSANGLTTENKNSVGTSRTKPLSMVWAEMSTYIDSKIELGKANGISGYDLMAIPQPRISKTDVNHLVCNNGKLGMSAFITTKCNEAKAKEIVEWFDYLYTDEGAALMNYGVEGQTYTLNPDGSKNFSDEIKNNPDKGFYEYISFGFPTKNDTTKSDIFKGKRALSAENIWTYKNDGAYNLRATAAYTGSDGATHTQIMNAVNTYVSENLIKFVKGTRSLKEFDSYVATLKSSQYDIGKAVEISEKSYRAFLSRTIPDDWKN